MIDYKTFKKGYLNEWVDQSQAARRAAEELAKKDTTSLRDKYKPQNVIMTLSGKRVEFKGENEKKADGDIYFTYDEALKCQKEGWRLPTLEEFVALRDNYSYKYDKDSEQGIFDRRLYLPAMGYCYNDGDVYRVGSDGNYWSSISSVSNKAWYLGFYSREVFVSDRLRHIRLSVRLIRDIK